MSSEEKYQLAMAALQRVYDDIYGEDVLFDPSFHGEGEQRRYEKATQALELVRETIKQLTPNRKAPME